MDAKGPMRILVTAGSTLTPIDRVRGITNFSTGRTGTQIALAGHRRGHDVILMSSQPEQVSALAHGQPSNRWRVEEFRTFDELEMSLERCVRTSGIDAIVHVAAVSDYRSGGLFFWNNGKMQPQGDDAEGRKLNSDEPMLWLKLLRTPKLVDRMKADWGFQGVLVKFKLEVGIEESALLAIAEKSRKQSQADLMVANTLEQVQSWAYLGPLQGEYERLSRAELPERLIDVIERMRH